MIQRKQIQCFAKWHGNDTRKPLILRGARQVGKTTLVRQFCEKLNLHIIEINLEFDVELRSLFAQPNPEKILEAIAILKNETFTINTLLFIDEIQQVPEALVALRYFFEKKPELAVIAAGSLLDFVLDDHLFSMPVGRVQYMFLGPLHFSEFLGAINEKGLQEVFLNFKIDEINL